MLFKVDAKEQEKEQRRFGAVRGHTFTLELQMPVASAWSIDAKGLT